MDTLVEEAQGKFPQYSEAIAAQRDRFGETIVGAIEGTVQLLDTLHQRDVPLYGLTNWARETYQFAEQFSFLERFIDVVVSGFEEVAKPEAEIFLRLLDRNKLDAEQGFFIDDSPANVAAAQKLGLRAHTFTTPETLAVELRALRLLE